MTNQTNPNPPDLREFDKIEWFDVMRRVRPGLSQPEFDEIWARFQTDKRRRAMQ